MRARTIRSCSAMPEHTCVVCGNTTSKDPSISFHRFPEVNDTRRARWLHIFGMDESQLKSQSRVCSRHLTRGDSCSESVSTLGKRFASPIKLKHPRAKRAKVRETNKTLATLRSSMQPPVRSNIPVSSEYRHLQNGHPGCPYSRKYRHPDAHIYVNMGTRMPIFLVKKG